MARWICVTHGDEDEEHDVLINLDNVTAVIGRTLYFVGGSDEDYLTVRESHTELTALIARAEGGEDMTLNEYQELAARTINPTLTVQEQTEHALFGIASEVGELNGLFQKRLQGHVIDEEHLLKECGDILWMLAEILTARDHTLEDVACMNIAKLKARYPDGFDAEHSLHRGAGDV